ncbi:hypothetical protein OC844_005266 [Tilletia horrida]|nr:hypothetical protein OC844_005266 [Tilletia horrida]
MHPVELTTERLLLRPFQPADAAQVYEICQDADIQRFTTVPSPYTPAHAHGFCATVCPAGWEAGNRLTWAIVPRPSAAALQHLDPTTILGNVVLMQREFVLRSYPDGSHGSDGEAQQATIVGGGEADVREGLWEIGYWVNPLHRRKGYLTEALEALLQWAFFDSPTTTTASPSAQQLTRDRVQIIGWRAQVGNHASRKIIAPLGFEESSPEQPIRNVRFVPGAALIDIWSARLTRDNFVRALRARGRSVRPSSIAP